MDASAQLRPKYTTPPVYTCQSLVNASTINESRCVITLQSRNAMRICAKYPRQTDVRKVGNLLPLFTVAPISPLVARFILSSAMARSASFKNFVDSGRSGRKKNAMTAIIIAGTPYNNDEYERPEIENRPLSLLRLLTGVAKFGRRYGNVGFQTQ
jgi:hypothetical protein